MRRFKSRSIYWNLNDSWLQSEHYNKYLICTRFGFTVYLYIISSIFSIFSGIAYKIINHYKLNGKKRQFIVLSKPQMIFTRTRLLTLRAGLLDILARRRKERRLPKSCIFFEVAVAQVLGRDKPVLFLSDRFCCARLCLNARAVTNTWAQIIKHMQMNLIVKTRSTVTDHCHYWDQYLHFITTMKSWTKP